MKNFENLVNKHSNSTTEDLTKDDEFKTPYNIKLKDKYNNNECDEEINPNFDLTGDVHVSSNLYSKLDIKKDST